MTEEVEMRPLPAALFLALLALAGLIPVAVAGPAPAPASPQQATATPRASGCSGLISGTLCAQTARICDPVTVTARVEPICRTCPGGIHVVFIQADATPWCINDWTEQVMADALDTAGAIAKDRLKVGVVLYGSDSATVALELTDRVRRERGSLTSVMRCGAVSGLVPYVRASNLALTMLKEARPAPDAGPMPCEFAVYMAFHSCANCGNWDDMQKAGAVFQREQIPLAVACPQLHENPPPDNHVCVGSRRMTNRRDYVEYPDRGLARILEGMIEAVDKTPDTALDRFTLEQFLPAPLVYRAGSASVPPTVVPEAGGTRLRWL